MVNPSLFPVDRTNPMVFIEHAFVRLSAIENVLQLNDALVAFLNDEVIQHAEDNADLFFVVGETWLSTIKRVVLLQDDITFPDGLLALPPLFERLNWIARRDTWIPIQNHVNDLFAAEPCVPNLLALLFVDAMALGLEQATSNFENNVDRIPSDQKILAQHYRAAMDQYQWPQLEYAA